MSTFPITSEQLRALSPFPPKDYKKFVRETADRISLGAIGTAKRGRSSFRYDESIWNPINGGTTFEGIVMSKFDFTQYAKDLVTEIQRNFPTSKIIIIHKPNSTINIRIDWSEDIMNPEEMFSD